MSRAPFQPDPAHASQTCPALIDLAALAEGRLAQAVSDELRERIEVHVADCASCMDVLAGLRSEAQAVAGESRMVLVPSHVLDAAMHLRESPVIEVTRRSGAWTTFARRGLAAAAAVGVVVAGYQVGQALTASPQPATTVAMIASEDEQDVTFNVLASDVVGDLDEQGVFALALAGTGVVGSAEVTP